MHTPSIAFRYLPPNSARFSYATEGALFISAQLSTNAVSALRKVREKERINTLGLTQNARRKGPSIEKLKVCIKVMLIIIPKEGEHVRIKSIKKVLNRKSRMHTKVFHERIRSLRSSDPRAYWRILNINNRHKKHTVDAISHDLFVEHFEKLGNILEEERHTFHNEADIFVHDDLENDISADEVLKSIN